MNFALKKTRGFSLIEILLVTAIVALLASGTVIWFFGYYRQAEIDSAAKDIIGILREAQARSMAGKDFKPWGVYFDSANNKAVLFRNDGSGYGGATMKEENYLSAAAKISAITLDGGGSEIIFNKPNGDTAQFGTIRIEEASNSANFQDITVNQLGKIDSR